jgi:hypothetical protein
MPPLLGEIPGFRAQLSRRCPSFVEDQAVLRPKIARRREQWKKYQGRLDPARLVFIDETWAKTNMAPLRGWAPVGERLHAKVPYGHWRTMTFLAALRCDRIDAPCVLDQPVNGQSFADYVEQCLVPTLSSGDIVVTGRRTQQHETGGGQSEQPQTAGHSKGDP